MTLEEAQAKYMGQRVLVKKGSKNPEVGGLCFFLGPNEKLNWPLQITVGGLPLTIDSLDQISLMPPPWTIGKKNNPVV